LFNQSDLGAHDHREKSILLSTISTGISILSPDSDSTNTGRAANAKFEPRILGKALGVVDVFIARQRLSTDCRTRSARGDWKFLPERVSGQVPVHEFVQARTLVQHAHDNQPASEITLEPWKPTFNELLNEAERARFASYPLADLVPTAPVASKPASLRASRVF
jgi:hypothetical protein